MKKIRVAINGFGRIGRNVFKIAMSNPALEVVAINDPGDKKASMHLLKYDSLYGTYAKELKETAEGFTVDGQAIYVASDRDARNLPWKQLDIDIVLECTGAFLTAEACQAHIDAGAKKVIISAPAKDDTPVYVMGVNADQYKGEAVISNASCTTNCLTPLVAILHKEIGIKKGLLTTVHSYTQDQRLHDSPHQDYRRARNATENIIPTSTGAAKTVTKVIPELKGKLDGLAMRVPTPVVSIVDFVAEMARPTTVEEVNGLMKTYAEGPMKGILEYCATPLVSMDFKGNPASSIFDSEYTMVMDGTMVKVLAWYDNEFGYSCRMVELAELVGGMK